MEYPIFHYNIEQNTEEWNDIRLGKITASTASCFLVGKEDELSAGALSYALVKAGEIITGQSVIPFFSNDATEHGHEYEPLAREKYNKEKFVEIESVGFVQSSKYVGCSPDGILPNESKGTEFKCFRADNHLHYVDLIDKYKKGEIKLYSSKRGENSLLDKKKWAQIQFSMMVTGYEKWSLGFYNPYNFSESELVVLDIDRDEETIRILKKQTELLISEIERLIKLVS